MLRFPRPMTEVPAEAGCRSRTDFRRAEFEASRTRRAEPGQKVGGLRNEESREAKAAWPAPFATRGRR